MKKNIRLMLLGMWLTLLVGSLIDGRGMGAIVAAVFIVLNVLQIWPPRKVSGGFAIGRFELYISPRSEFERVAGFRPPFFHTMEGACGCKFYSAGSLGLTVLDTEFCYTPEADIQDGESDV